MLPYAPAEEANTYTVISGPHFLKAAQDGQTVTVLKDLATAPVTTSAGITLDLDGHTLRIVSDTSGVAYGLQFTAGTGVVKMVQSLTCAVRERPRRI